MGLGGRGRKLLPDSRRDPLEDPESGRLVMEGRSRVAESLGEDLAERDITDDEDDLSSSNRSNSKGSKSSMDSRRGLTWKVPERRLERSCRDFDVSEREMRSEAIELRGDAGVVGVLAEDVGWDARRSRLSFLDMTLARDLGLLL